MAKRIAQNRLAVKVGAAVAMDGGKDIAGRLILAIPHQARLQALFPSLSRLQQSPQHMQRT